jgi:cytochrome c biogenesis protein
MAIGPALVGTLSRDGAEPEPVMLAVKFPNFDMMRKGNVVISVSPGAIKTEARYYTGLQVTRDPGVWVVYTGFILMILGCMVTFFMSHQQLVVDIQPRGGRSAVMVAGKANKNAIGYTRILDRLSDRLSEQERPPAGSVSSEK